MDQFATRDQSRLLAADIPAADWTLILIFLCQSLGLFLQSDSKLSVRNAWLSNWRPAGRIRPAERVVPAREAKSDFIKIVKMLSIIQ